MFVLSSGRDSRSDRCRESVWRELFIGNKGGIKHCQDSEPAYTEISMHESFLFLALPKASPCKRVIFWGATCILCMPALLPLLPSDPACFHQSTLGPLFFTSCPLLCVSLLILTFCGCCSLLSQQSQCLMSSCWISRGRAGIVRVTAWWLMLTGHLSHHWINPSPSTSPLKRIAQPG